MASQFTLHVATPADHDILGDVMFRAIREGDSPYTQAQRVAWMPRRNQGPAWSARLSSQEVVIGTRNGAVAGFMTLETVGYIDLVYILPDARGQGLFDALLHRIEKHAHKGRVTRLSTHASLMAQPAFARHGFAVVGHETITRNGQVLKRAEMTKLI